MVYTTLIRDQNGLGFSIAGGKGCTPFKDNTEVVIIILSSSYVCVSDKYIYMYVLFFSQFLYQELLKMVLQKKMENYKLEIEFYRFVKYYFFLKYKFCYYMLI